MSWEGYSRWWTSSINLQIKRKKSERVHRSTNLMSWGLPAYQQRKNSMDMLQDFRERKRVLWILYLLEEDIKREVNFSNHWWMRALDLEEERETWKILETKDLIFQDPGSGRGVMTNFALRIPMHCSFSVLFSIHFS